MKKKKQKVRKSAAKRFQVTKTGKVMFGHQYGSHKKLHKSKSRLRRQKEPAILVGKFAKRVKRMLGVA
jgi:large subunit ribosomal protein L35